MGYDFMLARKGTSGELFGFVRYVYKNSPAEKAKVKRGDLFLKVNDQQLTMSNYETLLFKTDVYTLSFASIANNTITTNGRTVDMTAIEMQENPILLETVFTYENKTVGYLVYNGFNSDFDIQLNDVFGKFKAANLDNLVIDLRYNGGGSVESSVYLASMIYGTDVTKLFAQAKYNQIFQDYIIKQEGEASLNKYFAQNIAKSEFTPQTPINTLNWTKKLHIIVSDNTASASELLINGLRPYMNITVIGINTTGKYVGSFTIKDWDENGVVNPNHKYAMQPIAVKYTNSQGVSDFVDGLAPNITAEEDFAKLIAFGDPAEDLLSIALKDIAGIPITSKVLKSAKLGLNKVIDSKSMKPFAHEMYINPINKKHSNQ